MLKEGQLEKDEDGALRPLQGNEVKAVPAANTSEEYFDVDHDYAVRCPICF